MFVRSSHLGARSGERNDDDDFQKGKGPGYLKVCPRASQSTILLRLHFWIAPFFSNLFFLFLF